MDDGEQQYPTKGTTVSENTQNAETTELDPGIGYDQLSVKLQQALPTWKARLLGASGRKALMDVVWPLVRNLSTLLTQVQTRLESESEALQATAALFRNQERELGYAHFYALALAHLTHARGAVPILVMLSGDTQVFADPELDRYTYVMHGEEQKFTIHVRGDDQDGMQIIQFNAGGEPADDENEVLLKGLMEGIRDEAAKATNQRRDPVQDISAKGADTAE
jgi:hypothetical protein